MNNPGRLPNVSKGIVFALLLVFAAPTMGAEPFVESNGVSRAITVVDWLEVRSTILESLTQREIENLEAIPNAEAEALLAEFEKGDGLRLRYLLVPATLLAGEFKQGTPSAHQDVACFYDEQAPRTVTGLFSRSAESSDFFLRSTVDKGGKIIAALGSGNRSEIREAARGVRLMSPTELRTLGRLLRWKDNTFSGLGESAAKRLEQKDVINWFFNPIGSSHYLLRTGFEDGPPSGIHAIPCSPSPAPTFSLSKKQVQQMTEVFSLLSREAVEIEVQVGVLGPWKNDFDYLDARSLSELWSGLEFWIGQNERRWPGRIISIERVVKRDGDEVEDELDEGAGLFAITVSVPKSVMDFEEIYLEIHSLPPFWLIEDNGLALSTMTRHPLASGRRCFSFVFSDDVQGSPYVDLLNHQMKVEDMPFSEDAGRMEAKLSRHNVQLRDVLVQSDYFRELNSNSLAEVWNVTGEEQEPFRDEASLFTAEFERIWRMFEYLRSFHEDLGGGEVVLQAYRAPRKGLWNRRASEVKLAEYLKVMFEQQLGEEKRGGWRVLISEVVTTDPRDRGVVHIRFQPESPALDMKAGSRHCLRRE